MKVIDLHPKSFEKAWGSVFHYSFFVDHYFKAILQNHRNHCYNAHSAFDIYAVRT